jgi:hypothetical protein
VQRHVALGPDLAVVVERVDQGRFGRVARAAQDADDRLPGEESPGPHIEKLDQVREGLPEAVLQCVERIVVVAE